MTRNEIIANAVAVINQAIAAAKVVRVTSKSLKDVKERVGNKLLPTRSSYEEGTVFAFPSFENLFVAVTTPFTNSTKQVDTLPLFVARDGDIFMPELVPIGTFFNTQFWVIDENREMVPEHITPSKDACPASPKLPDAFDTTTKEGQTSGTMIDLLRNCNNDIVAFCKSMAGRSVTLTFAGQGWQNVYGAEFTATLRPIKVFDVDGGLPTATSVSETDAKAFWERTENGRLQDAPKAPKAQSKKKAKA